MQGVGASVLVKPCSKRRVKTLTDQTHPSSEFSQHVPASDFVLHQFALLENYWRQETGPGMGGRLSSVSMPRHTQAKSITRE